MMSPTSLPWFARHELRLAFRDMRAMLTAGHPTRLITLAIALLIGIGLMHLLAYGAVASWVASSPVADSSTFLRLTAFGLLFGSVMASQALESVTRSYYGRADLDLILASPASPRRLFAVRAAGIALMTMILACIMVSPLINILAYLDGAHWLAAYAVIGTISAFAAAVGILITLGLFRFVGPKRTRFISQIVAAIVGAGFIIGIQVAIILHYNSSSRINIFQAEDMLSTIPETASLIWVPARAAMGEPLPLILTVFAGSIALALAIWLGASSFSRYAISTSGLGHSSGAHKKRAITFHAQSQKQALRVKEWRLLLRDPWLLSQMLMQILYLVPPALLIWVNFDNSAGIYVVIVPVLVMASGQLAGGLAWLAISGEDAPDLVTSAPVSAHAVLTAKVEVVLFIILVVLSPLLALMALNSLRMVGITAFCTLLAVASATVIQLWFRTVSKRSMFRRRQTASRVSTLCEALVSIMWAATAALWASQSLLFFVLVPAILALFVLLIAYLISPKQP